MAGLGGSEMRMIGIVALGAALRICAVRTFRSFLAVCLVLTQVGCADMLLWPGFESHPGIFSYPEQLPAAEVAEQVRCELAQYLREEEDRQNNDKSEGPRFLDPNKGAQVQLKLTTDLQGSVSWLGIDLKSLGLGSVAALVTQANKVPSLQLKAQGKSTQISQVDFIIPQTTDNIVNVASKPHSLLDKKTKKPVVDKDGKLVFVDYDPVDLPKTIQLPNANDCSRGDLKHFLEYAWFRLWLANALQRYKQRLGPEVYGPGESFADNVCQPKLTISTQFQLLFDLSAGTNVLQTLPSSSPSPA
jgi:hypothetical protein